MLSEAIFDKASLRKQIGELEAQSHKPDFWNEPARAQVVMRELGALRARIDPFERLSGAYADIRELTELLKESPDPETERALEGMVQQFLKDLDRFELTTLLGEQHDPSNAIVEIGAGAGGTEACDWVRMLFRMYSRWVEGREYTVKTLRETPGDVTGYRSISFLVCGPFAYGYLKSEHGVHRLVRISPFDASNKRHTTFAMVTVMPEVEEAEVEIRPEDLKTDTYRASGAGGQHVNKTESAVRIKHVPTGIVVTCQNERSQHKNRAVAMTILTARLAELERNRSEEHLRQLRGDLTPADWGHQIRSYVLQPYTLVKDLRTNYETSNVQSTLDGDLDPFIEAYMRSRTK